MIFEVLSIIVALLVIWVVSEKWKSSTLNLPPGPLRLPVLGNLLQLAKKKHLPPYQALQEFSQEYGPIMSLHIGLTKQVLVDDFETIKDLLCSEIWADRYTDDWILERSFGQHLGILFGRGDEWKEMRRFSLRTLRDFGFGKQKGQDAAFEEELTEWMSHLNKRIEAEGNVIGMNQIFTVSVLNILWSMMAGVRFSHDDEKLQKLVIKMSNIMKILAVGGNVMMAYPFLRHIVPKITGYGTERLQFINDMHAQFHEILEERRSLGQYKEDQGDFIDVFLKEIDDHRAKNANPNYFSDKQFSVIVLDLFVAGSETTSNSLEFAILFMIMHPNVMAKVQEEIDRVIGRSRLPTTMDKPNMPYTEATLLEVQRLANVVPMNARSPTQDTKIGPYDVKKGTLTVVNLYSVHRSEKLWEDPLEFRPERFLSKDNTIINTNKLLPFGLGKGMCLGEVLARATLFTFFTTVLQSYTFEKSPAHGEPTNENPRVGLTLAPQPYYAVIKSRQ